MLVLFVPAVPFHFPFIITHAYLGFCTFRYALKRTG